MAILWALWSAWWGVLPAASCPAQSGWPSPQTTPKHGNPVCSMEYMAVSALLSHPARPSQDGRLHRQLLNMSILVSMGCMAVSALLRRPARLSQDGRLHRQLLNMAILDSTECMAASASCAILPGSVRMAVSTDNS
jgi:hypothetical protein